MSPGLKELISSELTVVCPVQIGSLELVIKDNQLCELSICQRKTHSKKTPKINLPDGEISEFIVKQLHDYFSAAISFHNLPLAPAGTKYEKRVWNALCNIPRGETRTYGEIARILNSSPRAVGNACRKNPIAIIIPCHRVVSACGLGGYAGKTEGKQPGIKRWLLRHEGVAV